MSNEEHLRFHGLAFELCLFHVLDFFEQPDVISRTQ